MVKISDLPVEKIKTISVCKDGEWHEYVHVVNCVDCYKRNSSLCPAIIKGHTTVSSGGVVTENEFYLTVFDNDGYCSDGRAG